MDKSWIERTNPNDHPWSIRKYFTEPSTDGFWYKGGRIIYDATPDEEDDLEST